MLSIKNSVANENTPLLAPPPLEICARRVNENFRIVNENFRSVNEKLWKRICKYRSTNERGENHCKTCSVLKNEVKHFACNYLFFQFQRHFIPFQFIFSYVSYIHTKNTFILIGTKLIPYIYSQVTIELPWP